MMQNNDLCRLFSFDAMKNSKLNLEHIALSFKKQEDSPVASITVLLHRQRNRMNRRLRVIPSRSPVSLADKREVRSSILPGPEITGQVYWCFEKRMMGPEKVSRYHSSGTSARNFLTDT